MSRFQFYFSNGINTMFCLFSLTNKSPTSEQQQETIQHRKKNIFFQVTNIEKKFKVNRSEAPPIAWIREPYLFLIKTKTWQRAQSRLVAERSLAVLAFKGHWIETKFSPKKAKFQALNRLIQAA